MAVCLKLMFDTLAKQTAFFYKKIKKFKNIVTK